MNHQIGVYFESWSGRSLALVEKPINVVYLAFVDPSCTYYTGQRTFKGTGLEFSDDFEIVCKHIKHLKSKGIKVLLAVGGAYYWGEQKEFNSHNCVTLMNDLGCDGIDLDWEVGVSDDATPVKAIHALRLWMPKPLILSFTGFSTGAYDKAPGDKWKGMSRLTLEQCSSIIDHVNVMAYDAGPRFDSIDAFKSYRKYYHGIINIGFQVGKHGWGSGMLYGDEVKESCKFVKAEGTGGCFIWSYFKKGDGGISVKDLVVVADKVFRKKVKPVFSTPSSWYIKCPNCDHHLKLAVSDSGK